jgi:hypothetical protein
MLLMAKPRMADRAIVYATQGSWNSAALSDRVMSPAWKTKPSWFIAVNDRMLPPEYEQAIAKLQDRNNSARPADIHRSREVLE